jgi:hypothetical protein
VIKINKQKANKKIIETRYTLSDMTSCGLKVTYGTRSHPRQKAAWRNQRPFSAPGRFSVFAPISIKFGRIRRKNASGILQGKAQVLAEAGALSPAVDMR